MEEGFDLRLLDICQTSVHPSGEGVTGEVVAQGTVCLSDKWRVKLSDVQL